MFNCLRLTLLLCCLYIGAYASPIKQTQIDPLLADALDFFQTYQDLKDLGFSLDALPHEQSEIITDSAVIKYRSKRHIQIEDLFAYYCMSQYNLHWHSPKYDKEIMNAFRQHYDVITEKDMCTLRSQYSSHPLFPTRTRPVLLRNKYFPIQEKAEFRFWYTLSDKNWNKLTSEFISFTQTGVREKNTTLDTASQKSWNMALPLKYSNYRDFRELSYYLFRYFYELKNYRDLLLTLAFQSRDPELIQYAEQRLIQLIVRETKTWCNSEHSEDLNTFIGLLPRLSKMSRVSKGASSLVINQILTDPFLLEDDERGHLADLFSVFIPVLTFIVDGDNALKKYQAKRKEDISFQSFQKWNRLFEQINHPLRVTEKGELLLPKSEVETIKAYNTSRQSRTKRVRKTSTSDQPKGEVEK